MHKPEYIALHNLLLEIHKYADIEPPEKYQELDVAPEHIHKKKDKHKKAVTLLAKNSSEVLAE